MMVVEELVYDEECCPVSPVGVDEEGEGAKAVNTIAVPVVEGGEEEHEDDLGEAEHYLGDGRGQGGDLLKPGALL